MEIKNDFYKVQDGTELDEWNREFRRAAKAYGDIELRKRQKADDRFNDPMTAYKLREELSMGFF